MEDLSADTKYSPAFCCQEEIHDVLCKTKRSELHTVNSMNPPIIRLAEVEILTCQRFYPDDKLLSIVNKTSDREYSCIPIPWRREDSFDTYMKVSAFEGLSERWCQAEAISPVLMKPDPLLPGGELRGTSWKLL